MNQWLENLFKEIIWQALVDLWADIATWTEEKVETKLKELQEEVGKEKPLSSSPLVRVSNYTTTADPDVDNITFLIRGRVPLFKGVESVFMRVEITVSTDIDLMSGDFPITIVDWITVIGDLKISKKKVFSAQLGLGYDDGVWMGRGAVKILPAGFGLDLYLGGLSDRGAMIGLAIDLPAPIPLGSSGLGISGMGGDFAYNFIARLEKAGLPVNDPAANDYVTWARDVEVLNRWEAGPIDKTAVGVGINTDLVTLADNGYVLKLEPIGLAVLTPGPVFILGGIGKLLTSDSAKLEGYIVVDIASASMAMGMGVQVKIPKEGKTYLVRAEGVLDAFFSFMNPSVWYINLGTQEKQISAKVLSDLLRAELFFMINNYRMAFGAGISIGGEWKWWIIKLIARVGARVAAVIGWNPVLLEGMFEIWGELGIKIWKFGFILSGSAKVLGHTPDPTKLDVIFKYKLDLPWPIPDITGDKTLTLGDDEPLPPIVAAPLLSGLWSRDDETGEGAMKIGLLHALTGRQWETHTDGRAAWPDIEIMVPFSKRVTDMTGTVLGPVVSAESEGGYTVTHQLDTLTLTDITHGTPGNPVSGLQAVWAAGPGGDTARLHVIGNDPFSWVVPHVDVIQNTIELPGRTCEEFFGFGPEERFTKARRFNEMILDPMRTRATLTTVFQPVLPTRVLKVRRFKLRFRTALNSPIHLERITLFLLGTNREKLRIKTHHGQCSPSGIVQMIYSSVQMVALTIPLSPAEDTLEITSYDDAYLFVYAVRYTEARVSTNSWQEKVVLAPGQYKIELSGQSSAVYPGGDLPDSEDTTWNLSDIFSIDYPETLRPYIQYTTIGDSRIFFEETLPWNPTVYGFGFPIYHQYRPVVRFLVPYMDAIFNTLRMRISWETGETVAQNLVPFSNSAGESYLPDQSIQWVNDNSGTVVPDQEVVMSVTFSKAGPAALTLAFDHPDGREVKLDGWTCYVSRFDSFQDHLEWSSQCLTVLYGPSGRVERISCYAIAAGLFREMERPIIKGNRVDPMVIKRKATKRSQSIRDRYRFERVFPVEEIEIYPEELTTPPTNWRLPISMTKWLKPLDDTTAECFTRFAQASGSRFNNGGGDKLDGINDTVDNTTIEAVTDSVGRPLALWIRTPEPVDWRRVSASLSIRHMEQSDDCPTAYESRFPLNLTVEVLPGPDASSAFLVGALAGHRTRLPRGEYTLTLTFDTALPGLPRLRPAIAISGSSEQVTLTFLQPSGQQWPLPATPIEIPAGLLERLAEIYDINWNIIDALIDPRVDPELIEDLLSEVTAGRVKPIPVRPDPVVNENLAAVVGRLETVYERLSAFPGSQANIRKSLVAAGDKRLSVDSKLEVSPDDNLIPSEIDGDELEKGGM